MVYHAGALWPRVQARGWAVWIAAPWAQAHVGSAGWRVRMAAVLPAGCEGACGAVGGVSCGYFIQLRLKGELVSLEQTAGRPRPI